MRMHLPGCQSPAEYGMQAWDTREIREAQCLLLVCVPTSSSEQRSTCSFLQPRGCALLGALLINVAHSGSMLSGQGAARLAAVPLACLKAPLLLPSSAPICTPLRRRTEGKKMAASSKPAKSPKSTTRTLSCPRATMDRLVYHLVQLFLEQTHLPQVCRS